MKNKVLYIVLAVLVFALLGLYVYGKSQTQTPIVETNIQNANSALDLNTTANSNTSEANNQNSAANSNSNKPANNAQANNSQGQFSNEADTQGGVQEVIFDGKTFSPSSLTIKLGDTVVFKNESKDAMRVASNPHPTHTDYPEFDSKTNIAAGQIFEFKFTKIGSWGYHDHLNPSITGTVKVTK